MEGGAQVSVEGTAASTRALAARATVPLRAVVATVLLSVLLAVGLWQGLAPSSSSVAPAARYRASSHVRSHASAQGKKGLASLPAAAQGPISEALGADNPAYRVSGSGGGLRAATPAQHFSTQL